MLSNIDPNKIFAELTNWFSGVFFNTETLISLIVLVFCFAIGFAVRKMLRPVITGAILRLNAPYRLKNILNNLTKLIFHAATLLLLFIASSFMRADFLALDTSLINIAMSLLGAWIVIRIALQIIENNVIRNLFALAIWTFAALSIFGVLEETTQALDALAFSIGTFRLSALAVIKGLILIFALLYFATFAGKLAERRITKISGLTRSSQVLIIKIVRVSLIVFAILIAITSAGIDLSLFAVFGGAIGLGIGFGLQKGISNLFSGMLLLMDKSIKPGDVIEIVDTGTFGWVNHMAARHTEIVTRDNKSYLIPNEDFITQRVINWSHGNSLIRLQVPFGVHYKSDPHKVIKIAKEAAIKPERVADDPAPICWMTEFGDSSINFSLRFWIRDAEKGVTNIKGEVLLHLWDAFKEHGIEIPYPHREVYVHKIPSDEK